MAPVEVAPTRSLARNNSREAVLVADEEFKSESASYVWPDERPETSSLEDGVSVPIPTLPPVKAARSPPWKVEVAVDEVAYRAVAKRLVAMVVEPCAPLMINPLAASIVLMPE